MLIWNGDDMLGDNNTLVLVEECEYITSFLIILKVGHQLDIKSTFTFLATLSPKRFSGHIAFLDALASLAPAPSPGGWVSQVVGTEEELADVYSRGRKMSQNDILQYSALCGGGVGV